MKTAARTTFTSMLARHGIPAHHTVIVVDKDDSAIWGSGLTERGARMDASRGFNKAGCSGTTTIAEFQSQLTAIELY